MNAPPNAKPFHVIGNLIRPYLMIRNIGTSIFFYLTLAACGQTTNSETVKGLSIDPNIKSEVEKHIQYSKEFDAFKNTMQVYVNSGDIESYENDSLVFTAKFGENKAPFKSFYLWHGDTLTIDGAFWRDWFRN